MGKQAHKNSKIISKKLNNGKINGFCKRSDYRTKDGPFA